MNSIYRFMHIFASNHSPSPVVCSCSSEVRKPLRVEDDMSKVWLVTGASRGMGADIAKAALTAGYVVVASGRDADRLSRTLGGSNKLLTVKLDVAIRADADAAVRAAVDRFGRIDVL